MTTVTAIRELEATEVTVTCACGANAVVSNEDRDSCVTCAIHQWMQPEEIVAPTNEERLCVECGGAHLPLYDVQSHCGLCVEAMTSEEYEATAMATAEIARSVLIQTADGHNCAQQRSIMEVNPGRTLHGVHDGSIPAHAGRTCDGAPMATMDRSIPAHAGRTVVVIHELHCAVFRRSIPAHAGRTLRMGVRAPQRAVYHSSVPTSQTYRSRPPAWDIQYWSQE